MQGGGRGQIGREPEGGGMWVAVAAGVHNGWQKGSRHGGAPQSSWSGTLSRPSRNRNAPKGLVNRNLVF